MYIAPVYIAPVYIAPVYIARSSGIRNFNQGRGGISLILSSQDFLVFFLKTIKVFEIIVL